MKKWLKISIILCLIFEILVIGILFLNFYSSESKQISIPRSPTNTPSPSPASPALTLKTPLPNKILANDYHIYQTFNNCGPAALSMTLSYYGISETQHELGQQLRPFQNPQGDNDDKSVTLDELAEKSKDYGFIPYHRPNGTSELIKLFITYDIPVITRTWLKVDDDIGHYRVIKGYDDTAGKFIQDDSLQGKSLTYSYGDFDTIWKKFNYEYLVLIPEDKKEIAQIILGENFDFKKAWQNAAENAQNELQRNPDDIYARFNLSVALYNAGNFRQATKEFEKVENNLPFRTLWYQIEPIKAYYELGNYDRVFAITDNILNTYNRAFSELYIIRGNIYLKQGNQQAARQEFEKAVFYNQSLKEAQDALASI